ncbi:MAG: archease [Solirubrobacterales bacterium]|nr:archease [Solirubrobacterales bacterium]MBV9714514.1 archease [Solirubrobacterales bacterium]
MYRWAEHTAEVELQIEAHSEREVFADALAALTDLLGGPRAAGDAAPVRRTVTVPPEPVLDCPPAGPRRDRAALLAGWLEELVFLGESEGFVATGLADADLRPDGLSATVEGVLGAPPPLVKAVTLHGLMFEPGGPGYVARVVLDV